MFLLFCLFLQTNILIPKELINGVRKFYYDAEIIWETNGTRQSWYSRWNAEYGPPHKQIKIDSKPPWVWSFKTEWNDLQPQITQTSKRDTYGIVVII